MSTTSQPTMPSRNSFDRSLFRWIALVAVTMLVFVGFVGYQLGRSGDVPPEDGADVGFARDMQTHHNQAVQMALIIRDKTADPTLRAVAYDIATSQQQQSGQMYGWLAHWRLPMTSSDATMSWMSAGEHQPEDRPETATAPTGSNGATTSPGHAMSMPTTTSGSGSRYLATGSMGMATPDQLKLLQAAKGVDAERLFLKLMIAHHQGGVKMAEAALRLAEKPEVLELARAIKVAQTAEISQLEQLLKDRA